MTLEVSSLEGLEIARIRVAIGHSSRFARSICPTPRRSPSNQSALRRPAPVVLEKPLQGTLWLWSLGTDRQSRILVITCTVP
jgi:hypothetical protein